MAIEMFLHVGPNHRAGEPGTVWSTWINAADSKHLQMGPSVHSLADAQAQADRNGQILKIGPEAYQEMVQAGVAPLLEEP